jgi:glycosyltransferase involved in cell wall biosynthesis
MTHDPRFGLRFQNHPRILNVAALYDFIPMDWPGYLPTVVSRVEYTARLARLRKFDLFLPISEYTAWRLSELLTISSDRMSVTGACVRRSLYEIRDRLGATPSPYSLNQPYFVTFGGDDRRKNTEIAVKAVRHLNLLYGRRIPLKVIGFYSRGYKFELLQLAGHAEGAGFLEFHPSTFEEKVFYADSPDKWARPSISDAEVVSLHAGAIAAIAPSYIEGFSLPVAEASVCGCPVVASTCAAHMELVEQPEALFRPDDPATLANKLEALLNDPALRESLVLSQAHLGPKFHEDAVGTRFWSAVEAAVETSRRPNLAKQRKPRLAFLSPYLPDQSAAAFYTAMTIRSGENLFHTDLYTDTARPLPFDDVFRDTGTISAAPLLDGSCNAVISVLANLPTHSAAFEFFERYGGPCILHDSRLTHVYLYRLGQEKFLQFAGNLLGRSVSMDEVTVWLQDRNPAPPLLEPIIERASPLIVHTVTQQAFIKDRYGVNAQVTTCCPTVTFSNDELSASAKQAVRELYGIPPDVFLVASFGQIARVKGMDTSILAVELLRSWNIPAELYFVGDAGRESTELDRVSSLYDITAHVHSDPDFASDAAYRNFLIAADASVQLRTYAFGELSSAVIDTISAGLPCVTTSDAARSCDAPAYIKTVPDRFSPLQVAEQLALIWETQINPRAHAETRSDYLKTHNFNYYGRRLIEILGIA